MVRVIKFGVYNKQREKIIDGDRYFLNEDSDGGCASLTTTLANIQKEGILMQFTGLTDKNGKEVFEGDIVRSNFLFKPHNGNATILTMMGSVEYCEWLGSYCLKNDAGQTMFYNLILSSLEVIGTIYENPELLK